MASLQQQVQQAQAAGYTDQQIIQYLQQSNNSQVQQALKAGYTPDEIVSYLGGSQNSSSNSQPSASKSPGGAVGLLEKTAPGKLYAGLTGQQNQSTEQKIGEGISTAGDAALLAGLGAGDVATGGTDTPAIPAEAAAGDAAIQGGVGSIMNLLSKFSGSFMKNLPAAGLLSTGGDLQKGASLKKTLEDIPLNAASFALVDQLFGGLGKTGENLVKKGNIKGLMGEISHAANVSNADLEKAGATKNLVKTMVDYGANTVGHMKNMADAVTGKNGILSKAVSDALSKSDPISTNTIKNFVRDITGARTGLTKSQASVTSGLSTADKELYNMVNNAFFKQGSGSIYNSGQTLEEALTPNNVKAFKLVQDLESTAHSYKTAFEKNGDAANRIAASKFTDTASKIKDELFNTSGANDILAKDVLDNPTIQKISSISPKLGKEVQGVVDKGGKISDLRSLQAPFVHASNIGNMISKKADAITTGMTGMGENAVKAVGGAALGMGSHIPALMMAPFIATGKATSNIAAGAEKAAGTAIKKAAPVVATGAKAAVNYLRGLL